MLIDQDKMLHEIRRYKQLTNQEKDISNTTKKYAIQLLNWFEVIVLEQELTSKSRIRCQGFAAGLIVGIAEAVIIFLLLK